MKLPRDLSGEELVALLRRQYGYHLVRQRGSHMTLGTTIDGVSRSVTVPRHRVLRVGTLSGIVADIAAHLEISRDEVRAELFRS
jgi:predicted RNA binding protein YcfA (HicA-like mRNA interferase family)